MEMIVLHGFGHKPNSGQIKILTQWQCWKMLFNIWRKFVSVKNLVLIHLINVISRNKWKHLSTFQLFIGSKWRVTKCMRVHSLVNTNVYKIWWQIIRWSQSKVVPTNSQCHSRVTLLDLGKKAATVLRKTYMCEFCTYMHAHTLIWLFNIPADLHPAFFCPMCLKKTPQWRN